MDRNLFERWEFAEREARQAALQLIAALNDPDKLPRDHLFEQLLERRREATEALQDWMAHLTQRTSNTCFK